MPIETPKIPASEILNAQPGYVIYFVDENGVLRIKDQNGNVDDFRGADGKTIRNGPSNPIPSIGVDGDFYLNTVSMVLFGPKAGGNWPTGVSLKGEDGDAGAKGDKGDPGNPGAAGAAGASVLSGIGVPESGIGSNGDFYIDTATHRMYGPKTTGNWPGTSVSLVGPAGSNGTPGSVILSGASAPTSGQGVNGDFFLETTNSRLYGPKASGAWPGTYLTLKGSDGVVGSNGKSILNGAAAPTAGTGVEGDFYLETTNSRLYGPKGASTWPGTYTSLIGPAGPVTQWSTANTDASISTTEFQTRYTALGCVENVIRYYASFGWKGVINVPAGTYRFATAASGNRTTGLVAPGIEVKGASAASVIFTEVNAINESSFILQGVTIGTPSTFSTSFTNSSISNISASGSINATLAIIFNGQVLLNNSSLNTFFCSFKKGVFMYNGSFGSFGQGSIITVGDRLSEAFGIQATDRSSIRVGGAIDNDNSKDNAVGIILGGESILLPFSSFTIGKVGQTFSTGILVKEKSSAYISDLPTLGTVTNKYSQEANIFNENGIIADSSVSTFKYIPRSVNSKYADINGNIEVTSDDIIVPGPSPIPSVSDATLSQMVGYYNGQFGNLGSKVTNLESQVNVAIPSQFQAVWSALAGYGEGLTEIHDVALRSERDGTDYVVVTGQDAEEEELFRLDEEKNFHATVINRRGTFNTLLTTEGNPGELATSSDVASLIYYGESTDPVGFSQIDRATLSIPNNSGTVLIPTKFRNLYLTRPSVNTGNIILNFANSSAVFPGQKVTVWLDNYWNSSSGYTTFGSADPLGIRVDETCNGMDIADNDICGKWWFRTTFINRGGDRFWERFKEPKVYSNFRSSFDTSTITINMLPLAKREYVFVKVTLTGIVETPSVATFYNTYTFMARRAQTSISTLSSVTAATPVKSGTLADPVLSLSDDFFNQNVGWMPNCFGVLINLTPGDSNLVAWTCTLEVTDL